MIQKLADYIIRPKRRKYSLSSDLGGDTFLIDNKFCCERIDFEIKNRRNLTLKCSLFHRSIDKDRQYPLVLYCHGNSGNRTESYDSICGMLRMNILVLAFDFAGCGLSEGAYISLGYFEKDDIDDVFTFINKNYDFVDQTRIGIWGRSMGAVSTLLYASTHPNIRLLILDSPFEDLSILLHEYIDRYKIVSKIAGKYIYRQLKTRIIEQAGFDFEEVSPISVINNCSMPILFIHGTNDTIVPTHHSKDLFEAYEGEKLFIEIDEGHNETRSERVLDSVSMFVVEKFTSDSKTVKPKKVKTPKVNMFPSCGGFGESRDPTETTEPDRPQTLIKLIEVKKKVMDSSDEETAEEEEDVAQALPNSENMRKPFSRQSKRRMLYFKFGESNEEENKEQERNEEIKRARHFRSKTGVDLTSLLASKRSDKRKVTLSANKKDILVSKCDVEHIEDMVTIFQEMNEGEFAVSESETDEEPRASREHFRSKTMSLGPRTNSTLFCKSTNPEEANITTDDLSDTTVLEKKDLLQQFITCAAGSRFERSRKNK